MFNLLTAEQKDALLTCIYTSVYYTSGREEIKRYREEGVQMHCFRFLFHADADDILGEIFVEADWLPRYATEEFLNWKNMNNGKDFRFYSLYA